MAKSVEFTIRVDYIESINNYLIPVGKGKVAMSKECKRFKQEIKNQLYRSGVKLDCNQKTWFTLQCIVVFKTSFGRRDTNNCIKVMVDAICEYFGLNDNHLIHEDYRKMWKAKSRHEYIKCKISTLDATEEDFKIQ